MKEYIDKAIITAEVKRLAEVGRNNASCFDECRKEKAVWLQQADVCDRILSFLDTLDVKEVDLEDDVDKILEANDWNFDKIDFYQFAKHFFELGLKTQKEE